VIPTTSVPTTDKTQAGYTHSVGRDIARFFSFGNMSAIYLFILMFIVFSIWIPNKFFLPGVWRSLLDQQAIGGIAAVALVIPMVTGAINLAIGAQVAFGAMLTAVFLGPLSLPIWLQFPLIILIGAGIGALTGILITFARIDSIIATLGINSLLLGMIQLVSNGGLRVRYADKAPEYASISTMGVGGITLTFFIMIVVALAAWYVLERTPVGRRMYAVGMNPEGARLSGVNVKAIQIWALVAGGAIAGLAGALLQSRYVDGDPTIGVSYLLPALTAVFLGSTQFRGGRFNVWGSVVALYVLAIGINGLQLASLPSYVDDFFYGAALLLAVGVAAFPGTGARFAAIRRLLPWNRGAKGAPATAQGTEAGDGSPFRATMGTVDERRKEDLGRDA